MPRCRYCKNENHKSIFCENKPLPPETKKLIEVRIKMTKELLDKLEKQIKKHKQTISHWKEILVEDQGKLRRGEYEKETY